MVKTLNDRGQCCGRKPMVYKRPPHMFCPRCDASYSLDGKQQENWAYARQTNGTFVRKAFAHDR